MGRSRGFTVDTWRRLGTAGVFLCAVLGACHRGSRDDLTGPPLDPPEESASPVFEYVRQMINDPWFAESLTDRLRESDAAAAIRVAVQMELRAAIEARDLAQVEQGLESVRRATAAYRADPGFAPEENVTLSIFDLFVDQARGIRDGELIWFPGSLLRKDEG